jgi:pyruvate,water dikinase
MPFLISDRTPGEQNRAAVGGKAHNLFALTAAGVPVPRWSVLLTTAFSQAVAVAGVRLDPATLTLSQRLEEAARADPRSPP